MLKILTVLIFSSLIGCSTFISVPLPIPSRPELPKITGIEIQCLTNEVYEKFRRRDILQDGHIDKLEGILRATH
jgi:hypothetical protein